MQPSLILWRMREDQDLRARIAALLATKGAYIAKTEDPTKDGQWERVTLANRAVSDPMSIVDAFVAEAAGEPKVSGKAKSKAATGGYVESVDTSGIEDADLDALLAAVWTKVARRVIGDAFQARRG